MPRFCSLSAICSRGAISGTRTGALGCIGGEPESFAIAALISSRRARMALMFLLVRSTGDPCRSHFRYVDTGIRASAAAPGGAEIPPAKSQSSRSCVVQSSWPFLDLVCQLSRGPSVDAAPMIGITEIRRFFGIAIQSDLCPAVSRKGEDAADPEFPVAAVITLSTRQSIILAQPAEVVRAPPRRAESGYDHTAASTAYRRRKGPESHSARARCLTVMARM